MTSVTILPVPTHQGGVVYCAASNGKRSQGATPGEALDALNAQMSDVDRSTVVIVQNRQPDEYFTSDQQQRLRDLMTRWREYRHVGKSLPEPELAELNALVDAELEGATARAAAMVNELKR